MFKQPKVWSALLFLAPVGAGIEDPQNRATTKVRAAGGAGSYAVVSRGCTGNVLSKHSESFADVGGEIDHQLAADNDVALHVGARGGSLEDSRRQFTPLGAEVARFRTSYVNPYFSVEGPSLGVGFGGLWTDSELYNGNDSGRDVYPTGHLRIGSRSGVYTSLHILESLPLYSGGGYVNLGIGGSPTPDFAWWVGGSAGGVYDGGGGLVSMDFGLNDDWHLDTNFRFGQSEGLGEYGLGVGVTYEIDH